MVEVGCVLRCALVLIDTWWNVNELEKLHNLWKSVVLIDTWWNVND